MIRKFNKFKGQCQDCKTKIMLTINNPRKKELKQFQRKHKVLMIIKFLKERALQNKL